MCINTMIRWKVISNDLRETFAAHQSVQGYSDLFQTVWILSFSVENIQDSPQEWTCQHFTPRSDCAMPRKIENNKKTPAQTPQVSFIKLNVEDDGVTTKSRQNKHDFLARAVYVSCLSEQKTNQTKKYKVCCWNKVLYTDETKCTMLRENQAAYWQTIQAIYQARWWRTNNLDLFCCHST